MSTEQTFACLTCRDESSGYRLFWCPGSGEQFAGWDAKTNWYREFATCACHRPNTHGPHTWAGRCECWQTNPTVLARRDRAVERQAARRGAA